MSYAITAPAMVSQPREWNLEAVYVVWRMLQGVARAAKRRPGLSVALVRPDAPRQDSAAFFRIPTAE
jgi:hypothetical protein